VQAQADAQYRASLGNYNAILDRRQSALAILQIEATAQNSAIDASIDEIRMGEPGAVAGYFDMVLSKLRWPDGFHDERRIAFIPESKQIVVDLRLPTIDDIVPTVDRYKYLKTGDEISEVKKSERARRSLYEGAVAQTVLRTLHEVFSGDRYKTVGTGVVSAYVKTIDRSTGRDIEPYLVSVRVSIDEWSELDLQNVDPIACLKRLRATVSKSPSELAPVKPIVDINMVDRRFIAEQDILAELDNRPNLMELSPGEFESLITNLFQKMGLETKLTQASRDGGVDCVAFDLRPILGGKVIIQAKRYKNTVGVSAVRDLFGTMHNEGASKGILVTTSGYGRAAYEFANGKPLELITGSNLLYLLEEHAGTKAKIEVPEEWVDRLDIEE
ncbi:MAG: restriction endonuclease, partial [Candidatus Pacebacteria bacterium]|nr:restriction endonuclease [Candidatus Paceibacterota bacterium]